MKIRCNLKYYIKDKEVQLYDKYEDYTHFKFQVYSLKQELVTKHEYTELIWEESKLLKESELIEINKEIEKEEYFNFYNITWIYFQKKQNLYIYNNDLEI